MIPMLRLLESRPMMWAVGSMGDSCTMLGVYTAVRDRKFLGMGSQAWFMLALMNYLYFIMSLLSRVIDAVEPD